MTNGIRGGEKLSTASPYEQTFGTRHRKVGRPVGDNEPIFVAPDVDPLIALIAKRRAFAVLHEKHREELQALFLAEKAVLKRRGTEVVARDAGVKLKAPETEEVNHG